MEILPNNFKISLNMKQLSQKENSIKYNYNYSTPTFKGGKNQISKELSKNILKNLKLSSSDLKNIFSNPEKKKLFLEVIGGLLVSVATTITSLLGLENNNTEKFDDIFIKSDLKEEETIQNKNDNIKSKTETNITPETQVKTKKGRKAKEKDLEANGVKRENFKRAYRQHPRKEETLYSKYIENNFYDDIELWNANVKLFNQIAGENKDGAHIYEGVVHSNSDLLKKVLPEIEDAKDDRAKILEIVAKYSVLEPTDLSAKKDEAQVEKLNQVENKSAIEKENIKEEKSEFKIKINAGLISVLNGKDKLTSAYKDIIATSHSKEEAEDRLKAINELIYPWSNKDNKKLNSDIVMRALKSINQTYSDCLEELAHIYVEKFSKTTCLAEVFYRNLANKNYTPDAVKTYNVSIKKMGLSFTEYNELKKLGIESENIEKIARIMHSHPIELNDIKWDNGLLELKFPFGKPINKYFSTIKRVFELTIDEKISLEGRENAKFNKDKIVDELIKDYNNNGRCTYPNLVKYLYGPAHNINSEDSFEKHQWEEHFDDLIKVLNDDELFDPNLFSDHAKMRFLERFVLNNCNWYKFKEDTDKAVKRFIGLLQDQIYQNTKVKRYSIGNDYTGEPIVGAQVIIPDYFGHEIKFTLDSEAKIHTIF